MNRGTFDLNLLIVFDALMQERSVTRAGNRVGLSQPAMSHALSRLRHMLKDELFDRTPKGMVPTPRAQMLAQPLRDALAAMQLALEPVAFDPTVSDHSFAVAVNNYAAVVLAPRLVTAVAAVAPAVRLDIQSDGNHDVVDRLDRGDLDLALTSLRKPSQRFSSTPLIDDVFAVVMRRGHPASTHTLSPAALAALPHLDISSSDEDTDFIDRWLARRGLVRRVVMRAPYLSAASILVESDLVATLSRQIAQEFVRRHPLQLHKPPYESPRIRTAMLWHRRLDSHPAHRWLRSLIQSVIASHYGFPSYVASWS